MSAPMDTSSSSSSRVKTKPPCNASQLATMASGEEKLLIQKFKHNMQARPIDEKINLVEILKAIYHCEHYDARFNTFLLNNYSFISLEDIQVLKSILSLTANENSYEKSISLCYFRSEYRTTLFYELLIDFGCYQPHLSPKSLDTSLDFISFVHFALESHFQLNERLKLEPNYNSYALKPLNLKNLDLRDLAQAITKQKINLIFKNNEFNVSIDSELYQNNHEYFKSILRIIQALDNRYAALKINLMEQILVQSTTFSKAEFEKFVNILGNSITDILIQHQFYFRQSFLILSFFTNNLFPLLSDAANKADFVMSENMLGVLIPLIKNNTHILNNFKKHIGFINKLISCCEASKNSIIKLFGVDLKTQYTKVQPSVDKKIETPDQKTT